MYIVLFCKIKKTLLLLLYLWSNRLKSVKLKRIWKEKQKSCNGSAKMLSDMGAIRRVTLVLVVVVVDKILKWWNRFLLTLRNHPPIIQCLGLEFTWLFKLVYMFSNCYVRLNIVIVIIVYHLNFVFLAFNCLHRAVFENFITWIKFVKYKNNWFVSASRLEVEEHLNLGARKMWNLLLTN